MEITSQKVQVGKDQEKAQLEKDSDSKYRGGKNQIYNQAFSYTMKTYRQIGGHLVTLPKLR